MIRRVSTPRLSSPGMPLALIELDDATYDSIVTRLDLASDRRPVYIDGRYVFSPSRCRFGQLAGETRCVQPECHSSWHRTSSKIFV